MIVLYNSYISLQCHDLLSMGGINAAQLKVREHSVLGPYVEGYSGQIYVFVYYYIHILV